MPNYEFYCEKCKKEVGLTLTMSSGLQYDHLGARDLNGVLDFLPHVGNLTRNVIVRSAIGVDPHSAQIVVASDPLPTLRRGTPSGGSASHLIVACCSSAVTEDLPASGERYATRVGFGGRRRAGARPEGWLGASLAGAGGIDRTRGRSATVSRFPWWLISRSSPSVSE